MTIAHLDDRRPFLKWTGGKRWLTQHVAALMPEKHGRYFEPFLGGGSIFFSLRPWPATLSDVNTELINAYEQVRDCPHELMRRLKRLAINASTFESMRASRPRSAISRATRLLYLNRTAFNGLYRVNRQGEFNVPFGCKMGTQLCDDDLILSASKALQRRKLEVSDFERTVDSAMRGDIIFADPPYTTRHNMNGFRRYNECLFSWSDQERLASACRRATRRGANVIVSNAAHDDVVSLYAGFECLTVSRYTGISGSGAGRGLVEEKLFYKIF